MTSPPEPDLRNPDTLEQIFHAALKAGDTRGVEAALTVMATVDPHRAQRLLDATKAALAVAAGRSVTWPLRAEVAR